MGNDGEVYFTLYGNDFDPDEVTRMVGIEPSSVRRKADPIPRQTSWKVSSGKVENEVVDVYEMSAALVSKLLPYAERIAEVKGVFKLEAILEVVLWISKGEADSTPAIGFEPGVISFLNSVGASIDVDTYLKP